MNRSHKSYKLILTLSLLLIFAGASAQTQSGQQPNPSTPSSTPPATPTPSASLVKLNVIVTDAANHAINDVRQEELLVSENGLPQTVSFFSQEKMPVSYGLVVDNSGTMRTQMHWIVETCSAIIRRNDPDDETLIVRFVDSEKIEVVQEFTNDKRLLMRALDGLYTEGGQTALIDALYVSASRLTEHRKNEVNRRRALVLISDGDDRDSFYKKDELFDMLRKADLQIFIIGLIKNVDENPGGTRAKVKAMDLLERLARETGGRLFYVEKASAFQPAIDEITRSLHTQYVVGYTPTNQTQDGSYRKVKVSIAAAPGRDKRTALTRAGYIAPGAKEEKKKK